MKVKLFASAINQLSKNKLLKELQHRDKTKKHIVVCPDRSTLNTEKELFAILKEDCFFDISVITLSRLSSHHISTLQEKKQVLTKQAAVAIIQTLLLENKSSLTSFKNAVNLAGFPSELYNTICLFKSCHITPNEIDTNVTNKTLKNKVLDIKFIYEKYEEFLQNDFTDSFNQLNLFASIIDKNMFKDTHFYFLDFEDFTQQQYAIIEKLILNSASVNVATTFDKAVNVNNKNIHLNSIYLNFLDMCRNQIGVHVDVVHVDSVFSSEKDMLLKNLFSYQNTAPVQIKKPSIVLNSFETTAQEVRHALLQIKQKIILNNAKFKDFTIVVPSFNEYGAIIKKQCEQMNIPYYIDESTPLNNHMYTRYILQTLEIVCGDINKYNVLSVLKSPFSTFDIRLTENYEHYIEKYGIFDKALLKPMASEYAPIADFFEIHVTLLEQFKEATTFGNKLDLFKKIIVFAENAKQNMQADYLQNNKLIEFRTQEQVETKLEKILQELGAVLNGHQCTSATFYEIIKASLHDLKLTLPPIAMDAVFVGEINTSFFDHNHHVYILGANEGSMPSYQLDTSIITDKDINQLPNKNKLSPTVAMINKRKRFKIYETIFVYKNSLTISHTRLSGGGEEMFAAMWVDDIAHLLSLQIKDTSIDFNMVHHSLYEKDFDNFLFNNLDLNYAKENFVMLLKMWSIYHDNKNYIHIFSTLMHALKLNDPSFVNNILQKREYENTVPKLLHAQKMFFTNNDTSISQLESYFGCPYHHFMSYGLNITKLEEKKALDNGNIIHEFLKIIVPVIAKNYTNETWVHSSKVFAKNTMKKVLDQSKYEHITSNPFNNFQVHAFLAESERIMTALIYQQTHSKFMPDEKGTEKYFKNNSLTLNIGNRKIAIKGVIDRIDTYKDYYRIIDYKTGSVSASFDNLTDVYSGQKIQLFVYNEIYKKQSNMQPAGVFYLPVLNKFDKEDSQTLYKLQGIMVDNLSNILAMDDNLSKEKTSSKIINLSTDKDGKIRKNKFLLTRENLDKLGKYVFEIMERATKQILDGNIATNPLGDSTKSTCTYCDYKGVCNFKEAYKNSYRTQTPVNDFDVFENLKKEKEGK